MKSIKTVLVMVLCALAPAMAVAQSWPVKPVKIVVSSGAGGAADILARLIAERLTSTLGQPVIIDNKPGVGGHLGAEIVARSPADGYTLLMSGSPTHSVGPHLYKNLSYDPMRDVPPVAMLAAAPNLLVVNTALAVTSVEQLVQLARSKSGELNYSSAGNGTSGHLAAEQLKSMARINVKHIPYKGGPEAVTGVLTGDITFIFFTLPSVLPQVKAGKLRALAISSASRSPLAPEVPTVAESGYKDFEVLAWYGLFAPRGTPREVVSRLSGEIEKILRQPDIREKLAQLGAEPKFMNPEQLTAFVAEESPRWGRLIQASGAKAD